MSDFDDSRAATGDAERLPPHALQPVSACLADLGNIMKQLKHWQDPINGLIGVALILAPWMMGFADSPRPSWNAMLTGLVLVAVALGAMLAPSAWEEWTETGIGLWLIIAPWTLEFSRETTAMRATVVAGVVVVVLSFWVLLTDKDYRDWLGGGAAN